MLYYYGSQTTTPDCRETLTWIVNPNTSVITEDQLDDIKKLMSSEVASSGNYRDIQPLNDRTVYKFDNPEFIPVEESESGALNLLSSVVGFALLCFTLF